MVSKPFLMALLCFKAASLLSSNEICWAKTFPNIATEQNIVKKLRDLPTLDK